MEQCKLAKQEFGWPFPLENATTTRFKASHPMVTSSILASNNNRSCRLKVGRDAQHQSIICTVPGGAGVSPLLRFCFLPQ